MQSYVCIADFVYMQNKYGKPDGWGVAEYSAPEVIFGYDFITSAYREDPQKSRKRILRHLQLDVYKRQVLNGIGAFSVVLYGQSDIEGGFPNADVGINLSLYRVVLFA